MEISLTPLDCACYVCLDPLYSAEENASPVYGHIGDQCHYRPISAQDAVQSVKVIHAIHLKCLQAKVATPGSVGVPFCGICRKKLHIPQNSPLIIAVQADSEVPGNEEVKGKWLNHFPELMTRQERTSWLCSRITSRVKHVLSVVVNIVFSEL